MQKFAPLFLAVALALPGQAQTVLSDVSGNWAGASNEGVFFTARLVQHRDRLGLTIWTGMDGVPSASGDPDFDNPGIALGAFATRQALEVYESDRGTTLQVVVEFADEEAEGRSATQIQRIDNQYTITGYYHFSRFYNPGGEPLVTECDVDLRNMVVTENGQERKLQPVDPEALNASDWSWGAAFDRGYCSRTE